ncbi:hypothetical protein Tco_0905953 [Tanacetum coccineum]
MNSIEQYSHARSRGSIIVTSSGEETSSGIVSEEEIEKKDWKHIYVSCKDSGRSYYQNPSSTDTPLEQVQNNDEKNVFSNERQHSEKHAAECADERALANLIANLTLDTEENKTILKQLKESKRIIDSRIEKNKHNEFEKYKAFNDQTIDYEILQTKLNETLGLLTLKDIEIKEDLPNGERTVTSEQESRSKLDKDKDLKAQMQDKNIAISELKKLIEKCKGKSVETQFDKPSVVRQPNAQRITKPSVLGKPTPFSNSPEMRRNSLRTKKIWMPKIRKDDESTSISPTIDIVSRITNVLKISNSLGSNLSNVPSSSNSLADCTTHPIHSDQASVFMAMMSVHISSGLVLHQMTSDHNRSELGIQDHSNEQSSSKLVPKVVP